MVEQKGGLGIILGRLWRSGWGIGYGLRRRKKLQWGLREEGAHPAGGVSEDQEGEQVLVLEWLEQI